MNRQRGFTLIELIITLAIAAIVVTIGVPSFQAMMRNNRVAAHTNEFMSALNLARSEAIKRGWRVTMCPGDQSGCSGTAWGDGWIVFVDADADVDGMLNQASDGNGQCDACSTDPATVPGEQLLRVYEALDGNNTLVGDVLVSTNISFAPDGTTRLPNNNFQTGTLNFSLCNADNEQNTIVINSVGRAQVVPITGSCP